MRVLALAVAKGSSNAVSTDTYGVRVGEDYASAREILVLSATGTAILSTLRTYINAKISPVNDGVGLLGHSSSTQLILVVTLPDSDMSSSIFLRRNGGIMPTTVLVTNQLGDIFGMPGKIRDSSAMNNMLLTAVAEGAKAGISAANLYLD